MHHSISSLSYLLVIIADGPQPRERPFEAPPKGASHPCPENPENTANGSGKILESDSAQPRSPRAAHSAPSLCETRLRSGTPRVARCARESAKRESRRQVALRQQQDEVAGMADEPPAGLE